MLGGEALDRAFLEAASDLGAGPAQIFLRVVLPLTSPGLLAGFLMVMLRRVPKRTDSVSWGGFTFEVMDVDSHRIDQVMVTRGGAVAATPA